jgi:iron complex outermembrane recepter protein
MKKSIRLGARAFAPVLSVLSLAVTASVQAQTNEVEPVVVTGTRFESSPQFNPIATQVITSSEIEESSALTVAEVLSKLGGVHIRGSFTGIPDASVDLRGFGASADQNTLILVNGQRMSENEGIAARLSSIPMSAIDRIEILRGAGAVLYGAGATGGTINIITKAPTADGISGTASMLHGSHNLNDSRAGIQARQGDLGVMLNVQRYKTDNYRRGNHASLDAASGEIRLGRVGDFIALNFGVDNQKSQLPGVRKVDPATGLNEFLNDPRGVTTPADRLDSRSNFVLLRGERKLNNDLTVAMDVGQRHKTRDSFGTYDWGGTNLTNSATDVTTVSPRLLWDSQLAGMKNKLTVGADWNDWIYKNNTIGTGGADSYIESGKQRNDAYYFKNELAISSKTRLTIGARRESITQRSDLENLVTSTAVDRATQPRLNANEVVVQQSLYSGVSVYGRIGDSYRIANIDENRCIWTPCNALLKPQTSRDKEVGAEWKQSGVYLRASVFESDLKDEVHFNALTGNNENLPPTRRRGLELDGKFVIAKNVDVGARYAHTQAYFKEGAYHSYMGFDASIAGKDVPLVPKDRFSAAIGWQATQSTKLTTALSYVGSQRYDNDQANNFQSMPSYTVIDFKVNHRFDAWSLAAGINNLFNKSYYAYGVTNVALAPSRYNVYPEDRRNAYISAEYRF